MPAPTIQEIEGGVQLRIKVQPRSAKNQLCGLQGDDIKLKLTAPPVDGAANEACLRFFAELFDIPLNRIQIVSGQTGRNKIIRVAGLNKEQVLAKLNL